MLYLEPLIKSAVKGQGSNFNNGLSDGFATDEIVVTCLNFNVITLVFDINVPELAFPFGCLTLIFSD